MTIESKFASLLDRLATVTSVKRTRSEDSARVEKHGGANGDLAARKARTVSKLERLVSRLEA